MAPESRAADAPSATVEGGCQALPDTAAVQVPVAVDAVSSVQEEKQPEGPAPVVADAAGEAEENIAAPAAHKKAAVPALVVTGLRDPVTQEHLMDVFGRIGPVSAVRLERSDDQPLCAYVDYFHREDAERAVDVLNFSYALGQGVRVGWTVPPAPYRHSRHQHSPGQQHGHHQHQQQMYQQSGMQTQQGMSGGAYKQPRTPSGHIVVRNIDAGVTEAELRELCSQHGRVMYCKLMTSQLEHEVVQHAFVHFASTEDAVGAVNALNGFELRGLPLSVLHQTVRRDNNSSNNNSGYNNGGHYQQQQQQFNSNYYGGRRGANTPPYGAMEQTQSSFTNLYVKNIPEEMTDAELRDIFSPFGAVTSHVLVRDDTGRPRGFGFVNFERHEDAQRAVTEVNGRSVHGRDLYVGRAQKKHERDEELRRRFDRAMNFQDGGAVYGMPAQAPRHFQPYMGGGMMEQQHSRNHHTYQDSGVRQSTLFVKSVNDGAMDEELIRRHFEQFGAINGIRVLYEESGASRGFGFVTYANSQDAMTALQQMNGVTVDGVQLYVANAQRKDTSRRNMRQPMAYSGYGGSQNNNNNGSVTGGNVGYQQPGQPHAMQSLPMGMMMPPPPPQFYQQAPGQQYGAYYPPVLGMQPQPPTTTTASMMMMPPSPAMSPTSSPTKANGSNNIQQQQQQKDLLDVDTQCQLLGTRIVAHLMQTERCETPVAHQVATALLISEKENLAVVMALLDGPVAALDAKLGEVMATLSAPVIAA